MKAFSGLAGQVAHFKGLSESFLFNGLAGQVAHFIALSEGIPFSRLRPADGVRNWPAKVASFFVTLSVLACQVNFLYLDSK